MPTLVHLNKQVTVSVVNIKQFIEIFVSIKMISFTTEKIVYYSEIFFMLAQTPIDLSIDPQANDIDFDPSVALTPGSIQLDHQFLETESTIESPTDESSTMIKIYTLIGRALTLYPAKA